MVVTVWRGGEPLDFRAQKKAVLRRFLDAHVGVTTRADHFPRLDHFSQHVETRPFSQKTKKVVQPLHRWRPSKGGVVFATRTAFCRVSIKLISDVTCVLVGVRTCE